MKKHKIVHYRDRCIGCNVCVEIAPDRWRISKKDGRCTLVGGKLVKGVYNVDILPFELEENIRAARSCPVNIIKIDGKQPR